MLIWASLAGLALGGLFALFIHPLRRPRLFSFALALFACSAAVHYIAPRGLHLRWYERWRPVTPTLQRIAAGNADDQDIDRFARWTLQGRFSPAQFSAALDHLIPSHAAFLTRQLFSNPDDTLKPTPEIEDRTCAALLSALASPSSSPALEETVRSLLDDLSPSSPALQQVARFIAPPTRRNRSLDAQFGANLQDRLLSGRISGPAAAQILAELRAPLAPPEFAAPLPPGTWVELHIDPHPAANLLHHRIYELTSTGSARVHQASLTAEAQAPDPDPQWGRRILIAPQQPGDYLLTIRQMIVLDPALFRAQDPLGLTASPALRRLTPAVASREFTFPYRVVPLPPTPPAPIPSAPAPPTPAAPFAPIPP